jgi:ABC-type Fe3+-hydroxamate transport system substrate-binding protein
VSLVRAPTPLPRRIVSLVPSLTEALFALGLGARVVGVTEWCVHPAEAVAALPKVGGTKNPDLAAIRALRPELVIANREENKRQDVERLEAAGIAVWVTYPRTVADGVALLRELALAGGADRAIAETVEPVEQALAEAQASRSSAGPRVFCPIWKRPWMAVGADTYAHDLITVCGGANVFAERGDRRYPIVSEEEIVAAAPEVVLLPDEPYAFGPLDAAEIARLPVPASRAGRVHLVDGTLLTWYGPRVSRALATLRGLLAPE